MTEILVVGAGPVGLTLAGELARHGARCRIVDRLPRPSPYCRAIGVTPRTLEVWEDMGVARDAVDAGLRLRGLRSIVDGHPPVDAVEDHAALPYAPLGLPQYETERVLERHLGRFGVTVERGVTLAGLSQDRDGVAVELAGADGQSEQACFRYVVGCDGAHSTVRRALGIAFDGEALPMAFMLGDVHIGWDLPYGMSLRALRLHADAPPDMFIAIPLPERGRYRVSMLAPSAMTSGAGGTEHGIQAEVRGPELDHLQAIADDLLPDRPRLSALRWSSVFRISMRLAERYRTGRVFIAGDAAHIHPPTGGQGMNTGIQDAYNLAWKLALVLRGAAPEALLDSYEAERRPVGADVVARTRAASLGYGREAGGRPDRLADTQILVSYRETGWVSDGGEFPETDVGLMAGDRAPDVVGLRRRGIGFPLRLFDLLRGTEHVLLAHVPGEDVVRELVDLERLSRDVQTWPGAARLRIAAVVTDETSVAEDRPGVTLLQDCAGAFAAAYGGRDVCFLVRPDGHLGWRGRSWRDESLVAHLGRVFLPALPPDRRET